MAEISDFRAAQNFRTHFYRYNLSYIAPFNKYIPTCNNKWQKSVNLGRFGPRIEENYSLKLPRIPNQRNFWLIFGMDELMTSKSLLLDANSGPESSGTGLKSGSAYDLVDLVTLAPLSIIKVRYIEVWVYYHYS